MSSNAIAIQSVNTSITNIENVLINGDLSRLNEGERLSYYKNVCASLGLNPLTRPFDYITLNGKLTFYARKDCAEQLRKLHNVSIKITDTKIIEGVYVVVASAKLPDGREDAATGAVSIANLKGEQLANAYMKSETKAKRRATLSICGLGMLDESEVESIQPSPPVAQPEFPRGSVGPSIAALAAKKGEYVIPFGKFKGKAFSELDSGELADYCTYIHRKAADEKKPIQGTVAEFMDLAGTYLDGLIGPSPSPVQTQVHAPLNEPMPDWEPGSNG